MKLLFATMYPLFIVTALITHIWTVFIAFQVSGSIAAMLTLFLPFLSELYWVTKSFGEDEVYTCIAFVHLAVGIIWAFTYARSRFKNMVSKS